MFPFSKRFKYNRASVEGVLIGTEDCRHSEHRAWHQLVSNATQHARRCQRRQSFYSTHCHAAILEHIAFQLSAYWNFIGHVEHFFGLSKIKIYSRSEQLLYEGLSFVRIRHNQTMSHIDIGGKRYKSCVGKTAPNKHLTRLCRRSRISARVSGLSTSATPQL